jgi:hypothetical protein
MVKGVRVVLAGLAAIALGGMLLAVPEVAGISWYEPAAAFLAGLLLIALGVHTMRSASAQGCQPEEPGAGGEAAGWQDQGQPGGAREQGGRQTGAE